MISEQINNNINIQSVGSSYIGGVSSSSVSSLSNLSSGMIGGNASVSSYSSRSAAAEVTGGVSGLLGTAKSAEEIENQDKNKEEVEKFTLPDPSKITGTSIGNKSYDEVVSYGQDFVKNFIGYTYGSDASGFVASQNGHIPSFVTNDLGLTQDFQDTFGISNPSSDVQISVPNGFNVGMPSIPNPQADMPNIPNPQTGMPNIPNPQTGMPSIPNPQTGMPNIPNPQTGMPNIPNPQTGMPSIPNPQTGMPSIPNPQVGMPGIPSVSTPSIPNPQAGMPEIPSVSTPSIPNPQTGMPGIPSVSTPSIPNPQTGMPGIPSVSTPSIPNPQIGMPSIPNPTAGLTLYQANSLGSNVSYESTINSLAYAASNNSNNLAGFIQSSNSLAYEDLASLYNVNGFGTDNFEVPNLGYNSYMDYVNDMLQNGYATQAQDLGSAVNLQSDFDSITKMVSMTTNSTQATAISTEELINKYNAQKTDGVLDTSELQIMFNKSVANGAFANTTMYMA